jgi:tetratricopeptide (TPR) repeat protein
MLQEDKNLGPLPKSDRNTELSRRSLTKLKDFLPADKFLFREEYVHDVGVDGSLELLINSSYTNLRSQVQLKSTNSEYINQDGTVSVKVSAGNLNYLLNGSSPMYVLYVAPRNEFRFAWARDERKRLDATRPDWMQQKNITISFKQLLTNDSLEEIHKRIKLDAQSRRKVADVLDAASSTENVMVRIGTDTLRVTDPTEAKQILLKSGISIVSAGYISEVEELMKLLGEADSQHPRILLVLAHAKYTQGKYLAAMAAIREASLRLEELSEDDRLFLKALNDGCEYQTGRIEISVFIQRTSSDLAGSKTQFASALKLSRLRHMLLDEGDLDRRKPLLEDLNALVSEIDASENTSDTFKLFARISLIEAEGYHVVFLSMRTLSDAKIKANLGRISALPKIVQDTAEAIRRWQGDMDQVLQDALAHGHTLLLATALTIQATIAVHYLTWQRKLSMNVPEPSESSQHLIKNAIENMKTAVEISRKAKNLEAELRAKILLADLYEFEGRHDEAKEIARSVFPKAKAMEYAAVAMRAEAHISGQSLLAKIDELGKPKSSVKWASIFADFSDEELRRYARRTLELAEVPIERLPIVEREYASYRDIAKEKLHWCRHIELIQDLAHESSPDTHFRKDPTRYCMCNLLKYASKIGDRDWSAIIGAFKRTYCEGCVERSPHTPTP